jgi:hypothetical protein
MKPYADRPSAGQGPAGVAFNASDILPQTTIGEGCADSGAPQTPIPVNHEWAKHNKALDGAEGQEDLNIRRKTMNFSNPRLNATFTDWPLGSNKRGNCTFTVHDEGKKGQRVSRTTVGKPKFTTYGTKMCIVDGDNGKTYILQFNTKGINAIRVIASDLNHDASDIGFPAYVFSDNENYNNLLALLNQV